MKNTVAIAKKKTRIIAGVLTRCVWVELCAWCNDDIALLPPPDDVNHDTKENWYIFIYIQ